MKGAARNEGPAPRPVFLIGPGRSGTTLLYKLLCLHPAIAYPTSIEQRFPWVPGRLSGRVRAHSFGIKLRAWFGSQGNAYYTRRRWIDRLVPAPAECEALYRRSGTPLFPAPDYVPSTEVAERLRSALMSLAATRDSVVVSKRTANNRRIEALHHVFPEARFICLQRDGREVAHSLARVDWWSNHPLWWDERRRTPAQAVAEGEDMLGLCARNWVAETERIADGLRGVPERQKMYVRYEALLANPVDEMRRVCDFLALTSPAGFESALDALELGYRPGRWRQAWSSRQIDLVNEVQGRELSRLGYAS